MSFFQHASRMAGLGATVASAGSGGGSTPLQRLTKLYQDTKQSYESNKPKALSTTGTAGGVLDDPDVRKLRRDFQIQQDRLLAWGMHWADVEAQTGSGGGCGGSGHAPPGFGVEKASSGAGGLDEERDIDKKIDQAGLGEVVASVMSQIKSLLDESGRLQHPANFEQGNGNTSGGTAGEIKRKEWTRHEVQTGRLLLIRLTECIDLLYSLSDGQQKDSKEVQGNKKAKEGKPGRGLEDDVEAALYGPRRIPLSGLGNIKEHPLYIEFSQFDFQTQHSGDTADPPPYSSGGEMQTGGKDRVVGFWRDSKKAVLIDFLPAKCPPLAVATSDDVFEMHELGEKLKKDGQKLSFYGHLRLLGFTVETYRCGMVYELPDRDQKMLQKYQSLSAVIDSTYNQESAKPPLENKFRLAYNILISVLGYLAHGDTHRHVSSNNIILFPRGEERPQLSAGIAVKKVDIRSGFLLQSCEDFDFAATTGEASSQEPLESEMYRHPEYDLKKPDSIVPAFDIYSLGLVLLEIGLWVPMKRMWKSDYDRSGFMMRAQRLYSQKLASKMGSKYMRLVQKCLHAPAELLGKDETHQSAIHLLEIVKELRLCLALDEGGVPPGDDLELFEVLAIEQMCRSEEISSGNGKVDHTSLPPLQIPGAFSQSPEIGITPQAEIGRIKRKSVPGTLGENTEISAQEAQQQRRVSRREHRRSASTSLHKWPELPISQADLDIWNTLLMPKLRKILQEALQDSPESASVSLLKIGATAENAKTTICVQCHNTARVHEVLRKRFRPKKGWGLVILKGDVRRSGVRRRNHHHHHQPPHKPRRSMGMGGARGEFWPSERKYQEKPTCGASIGAFRDNEHLPPVSFGGTILVDGEPFGMTVHHMLDPPSDVEDEEEEGDGDGDYYSDEEDDGPRRSMAPGSTQDAGFGWMGEDVAAADLSFIGGDRTFSSPGVVDTSDLDLVISDDGEDDDDVSDSSTIRPDYSITDDSGHEFWFLDDGSETSSAPDLVEDEDDQQSTSSDDEDDVASIGDKPAVLPYTTECDELAVTQPAIDDVDDDFFVGDADDRDEDHLSSHTFGYIHASSGIRRVMRGQLKHEVDWALIRIDDDRLDLSNRLLADKRPGGNYHHHHNRGIVSRRPVGGQGSGREHNSHNNKTTAIVRLTKVVESSKLSNLTVACHARSSGFSSGKISPAMCLVKLHGRQTFSYSWTVVESAQGSTLSHPHRRQRQQKKQAKPDLGTPGDSGAWIYCPETGELAGQVLAYGEKLRQCYMVPMDVLFEDIRVRLGAGRVELPGALNEAKLRGEKQRREEAAATTTAGASTPAVAAAAAAAASFVDNEMRQDSGIGLDREVEMGLRELRLDEQHQHQYQRPHQQRHTETQV